MFELVGLGRFKGSHAANITVPLFGVRTSNYTYTHELNQSFVIQRFRRVSLLYFEFLPYQLKGKFTEGGAGLISFERGAGNFFVGTQIQLLHWWSEHHASLSDFELLKPILMDIVSKSNTEKFDAWRRYYNHRFSGFKNVSDTIEAKHASIQSWSQLWESIDSVRKQDEQDTGDAIKTLMAQDGDTIYQWLSTPANFSNSAWRVVWEHADRHHLYSDISANLIEDYLEFCLSENSALLHGDIGYFTKRAMSFVWDSGDEDYHELLRQFLSSGLALLNRSRIRARDFASYCKKLFRSRSEDAPGTRLVDALTQMLSEVTWIWREDSDRSEAVNFKNVECLLILIRDAVKEGAKFNLDEVKVLSEFMISSYERGGNYAGFSRCVMVFNEIVRPFGIGASDIRKSLNASNPSEYIYERLSTPRSL